MKQIFLVIIIFVGLFSSPVVSQNDNYLSFSKIDLVENAWTNMTIENLDYKVSSDLAFHDDLKGTLLTFEWNELKQLANSVNFFELKDEMENYTISLTLSINGKVNTIRLDLRLLDLTLEMSQFLSFIEFYHGQISGIVFSAQLWPVNFELGVLESFPPQYDLSVLFQRGNDLLTVVMDENLTLVSGEVSTPGNFKDLKWVETAPHVQRKVVEIASGRQTEIVEFDRFSFGSVNDPYDYENFGFALFMGEQILFQYHLREGSHVSKPSQDVISAIPSGSSSSMSIPFPILSIFFAIIIIPLTRKIKINNQKDIFQKY